VGTISGKSTQRLLIEASIPHGDDNGKGKLMFVLNVLLFYGMLFESRLW